MLLRILGIQLILIASLLAQFVPNQYIVELKEDNGDRVRMRARQSRMDSALRGRGFRQLGRTERVLHSMIVETPDDGGNSRQVLEQMPDVAKVYKVRLFKKNLEQAAQVHNVTAAWERLGLDQAGRGIKIGILDSGIELSHPGFRDDGFAALEGYPKAGTETDLAFTNRKVIVARSYSALFSRTDPDPSVLDRSGHGTAVAMAAAGVRHQSTLGSISGMAPSAYLGVYKIFGTPGINDGATDASILKAIDDAVADGMDIINLSFGTILAARPENDVIVKALERAEAAGVIAVVAAGNDGPGAATLGSPASAPTALTVGANENGHLFASAVVSNGETLALARAGSRTSTNGTLSGSLVSIQPVDPTELACDPLPANSFAGRMVLVSRGTCTFELKSTNIARAGGIATVIYSDAARSSDFITPDTGLATLPTVFITYADGLRLKQQLENASSIEVTLDLSLKLRDADPNRLASFSSRGPIPGVPIKPDVLAAGSNVLTASQTNNPAGDVYSSTGYTMINGTSFSSPIAAGMAAVLKAARPGLSAADYRSLLVNSARGVPGQTQLTVTQTGAGMMDLTRALDTPLRFSPVSVNFTNDRQVVEVRNLSSTNSSYRISVEPRQGLAPQISTTQLDLETGSIAQIALTLSRSGLDVGAYSGTVVVESEGAPSMRIPYWFGKADESLASSIQLLEPSTGAVTARSGVAQRDLVFFRVLDANGISVEKAPQIRVVSGTVQVREVQSRDFDIAGSFGLELVLGLGTSVIEIDAGNGIRQLVRMTGR
jgi:minor extracellular serine protease Vpr